MGLLVSIVSVLIALVVWQILAKHGLLGKNFPGSLETLKELQWWLSDPFFNNGPNDLGIGTNLLISLRRVMIGYFEDPEATAVTIDADGWLHTGDIGIMNESGYLAITDRKKDMFIVGGFNAYPAEIEATIIEHDSVAQVAVVGVADARMGEVGHAFVVARNGVDAAGLEAELISWSRERIANYKVPRAVHIVESLPTNAGGKVLKYELRVRAEALKS